MLRNVRDPTKGLRDLFILVCPFYPPILCLVATRPSFCVAILLTQVGDSIERGERQQHVGSFSIVPVIIVSNYCIFCILDMVDIALFETDHLG